MSVSASATEVKSAVDDLRLHLAGPVGLDLVVNPENGEAEVD